MDTEYQISTKQIQDTERHLNIMNGRGERISIFMNPSSDTPNINYSKFEKNLKKADYIVINIANYCRYILSICKKLNMGYPFKTRDFFLQFV